MEIEYLFYKIFDAIDKNLFEKAHAFVWKEIGYFSSMVYIVTLVYISKSI